MAKVMFESYIHKVSVTHALAQDIVGELVLNIPPEYVEGFPRTEPGEQSAKIIVSKLSEMVGRRVHVNIRVLE